MIWTHILLVSIALAQPATPAAGPFSSDEQKEFDAAMARLDPLIGSWRGEGYVRAARTDGARSDITTTWEIARAFDGRFLRLEFTNIRENGVRAHWVGMFTWDTANDRYATVWSHAGNGYVFQETGALDAEGKTLTLISEQDGPPDAGKIKVTSVFTLTGADAFTVEDRTPIGEGEPATTLWCVLKRAD